MELGAFSTSMCERDGFGGEIGRGRPLLAALHAELGVQQGSTAKRLRHRRGLSCLPAR
jgi:hypothetical protein